jgi:hypothetical protein
MSRLNVVFNGGAFMHSKMISGKPVPRRCFL